MVQKGGAVYADEGADVRFSQSHFLHNKAPHGYSRAVPQGGIAVYSLASLVECNTCKFVSSQPQVCRCCMFELTHPFIV